MPPYTAKVVPEKDLADLYAFLKSLPQPKPAKEIPLKGGYFELPLPRALFEGNPKSITVSWIDYYRG